MATGIPVLIGSFGFLPRPPRGFFVKTISSCFSIVNSIFFLPRRLLRVEAACWGSCSIAGDSTIISGGDTFVVFVLRPPRRLGDGG
jgi:hypothetical protein